MKKLWWIAAVVILGGAASWWYLSNRGTAPAANTFQRTAIVRKGDLVVSISATGQIQPIVQVDVKSKASGEILELPVEEGSYVKKGDLIARLDRTTAQNDYDQTQADHAVAEVTLKQRDRELKRQQSLFDKGLASESDLDNARLAFEQANSQLVRAKAALSTFKQRLDDTEIHSPIDGVVLSRPAETGQIISSGTTTVTGGTLLCTIANMDSVYVVADVDETDIGKVVVGMPATIAPDAYPDRRLQGSVLRIAALAKVQQNVTIFEVTTLVDNHDRLLKSGMNATVEVATARADDVLLLPAKAIEKMPSLAQPKVADTSRSSDGVMAQTVGRPQGSGSPRAAGGMGQHGGNGGRRALGVSAVQIRHNGVLTWVPIKVGLSNLDETAVLEGLAEGDTVVYSLTSGAMQQREASVERMRTMNAVPGMRRTN